MTAHNDSFMDKVSFMRAIDIHKTHEARGCRARFEQVYAGPREYALDVAATLARQGIRTTIKRDGIRTNEHGKAMFLTLAETCVASLLEPLVADIAI